MQLLTRLTATAFAVVTVVGLLVFACPSLFAALGLDVGELPELMQSIHRERSRCDALDAARSAIDARIEGKNAVAQELIDGKITLVRAAARVRDLCANDPELPYLLSIGVEGSDHNERLCRHVIRCAAEMLCDQPERAAGVEARFDAELRQHLRAHGSVVLP